MDVSPAVSAVSQSKLAMFQYTAVRALGLTLLLPVRLLHGQEACKWRHALSAQCLQRAELNYQLAVAPPTLRTPISHFASLFSHGVASCTSEKLDLRSAMDCKEGFAVEHVADAHISQM